MRSQHSGRRFVLVALVSVAFLWGALYLLFRDWRARYLERATFGRLKVATMIEPLAGLTPTGVKPSEWHSAVNETQEMLRGVTSANVLDAEGLISLQAELAQRVGRATTDTAKTELCAIWDDIEARAGHIIDRYKRPKLLQKPAPKRNRK